MNKVYLNVQLIFRLTEAVDTDMYNFIDTFYSSDGKRISINN